SCPEADGASFSEARAVWLSEVAGILKSYGSSCPTTHAHPSRNSVSYRINALSIQSLPYSMHRRRAILCTAISKRTMKRAHKTLRAKVRKIIKPAHPTQPEKAEISIDEPMICIGK